MFDEVELVRERRDVERAKYLSEMRLTIAASLSKKADNPFKRLLDALTRKP